MKPIYIENFISPAQAVVVFDQLLNDLPWLTVKNARKEYFMSDGEHSYAYGNKDFNYRSEPFTAAVKEIMNRLGEQYNVCFLNRYDEAQNALGWHADDSPEMDERHPIAVVSFGGQREIWWKTRDFKGEIPSGNRQLLGSGSLFVMPAGFQADHLHKIPKHDRPCGPRISLTFRRYI